MSTVKPIPDNAIPGELNLVGVDGNAFAIMGAVRRALRDAGNPPEVIEEYTNESMSGDYDHLLATAIEWTTGDFQRIAAALEPDEGE